MIVDLAVSIRLESILHFLGYPDERFPRAGLAARLEQARDLAVRLAVPRGTWRRLAVEEAASVGLEPLEAEALVIGLVTVGGALEEEVARALSQARDTDALLLDACADAAVEEAADRLGSELISPGSAAEDVPALSCRISPGYGRWQLQSQPALFARLPHAELGVELKSSLMMTPRKSVSFAMWLGAEGRPMAGLSGCATCALERCRYRRVAR